MEPKILFGNTKPEMAIYTPSGDAVRKLNTNLGFFYSNLSLI